MSFTPRSDAGGDTICVGIDGDPQQIDVIYRFWELFEFGQCLDCGVSAEGPARGTAQPDAAHASLQEEKLNLALFHHHILEDYWREALPKASFRILRKVIPKTWVMDTLSLPNAVLMRLDRR